MNLRSHYLLANSIVICGRWVPVLGLYNHISNTTDALGYPSNANFPSFWSFCPQLPEVQNVSIILLMESLLVCLTSRSMSCLYNPDMIPLGNSAIGLIYVSIGVCVPFITQNQSSFIMDIVNY